MIRIVDHAPPSSHLDLAQLGDDLLRTPIPPSRHLGLLRINSLGQPGPIRASQVTTRGAVMSEDAEAAAARLWRDRAQIREQERNEAQARARVAEEKVAILTAENDRLAEENARLWAQLTPTGLNARAEVEQQMKALQRALLPLLEPAKAQWQADKRSRPLRHQ